MSHTFKEGKTSGVADDETMNLLKEDIKNMQVNIKNLKENILAQINEHLTHGLSTLGNEQEKLQETVKNLLKGSNFSNDLNQKLQPMQQAIQNLETNFSMLSETLTEMKEKQKGLDGRIIQDFFREKRRGRL